MNLSDKAKKVIATIAPTLGVALGGPLGGLAGNILAEFLGDGDINQAILAQKPETLMAIRQAEADLKVKLREMDIEEDRLAYADMADARKSRRDGDPHVLLSFLFIGGYFLILALFIAGEIQIAEAVKDAALLLIGVITREIPTIMQYWFGSSNSSRRKDTAIINQAGAGPAP